MAPAMPCKTSKKSKHGETCGKTNEIKSKLACILEASESTRLRVEGTLPSYHEDHIAGEGDNSLKITIIIVIMRFLIISIIIIIIELGAQNLIFYCFNFGTIYLIISFFFPWFSLFSIVSPPFYFYSPFPLILFFFTSFFFEFYFILLFSFFCPSFL